VRDPTAERVDGERAVGRQEDHQQAQQAQQIEVVLKSAFFG